DTINTDLRLIELTGLSFTPTYLWMDDKDRFFAFTSSWFVCIRDEFLDLKNALKDFQQEKEDSYLKALTGALTETSEKPILINDVNIIDVEKGKIISNQSVLIKNNKIDKIDDASKLSGDYSVIDGSDKTLLPGLFDMHTHIGKTSGPLHLAAGVTSVRDLANSLDIGETADAFNSNELVGPRILILAGFIDQAGPYAGPTGKIINNLEEGLEAVSYYNENGYKQIKLYSSIDPAWVKPLAAKAHELGMRVSGHIPAYMIAENAVRDGYDEIQHVNMVALNFLSDTIDTRTPLRFSMIGKHTHQLDLTSEAFTSFVSLLKRTNTVVDPTVSIFEGMLSSKAGEPDPSFSMILDRLPVTVARGFYAGGLPIPTEEEENYEKSFNKLLAIIKALHESGVTIVPGTDAMAGFGLHRELENYVRAGISNADVLKIATITSAQVAGVSDVLGTVTEGKLADLILVDGNPLEDIRDIRRVELTIKDGIIYRPQKLYESVGVKHFQ
ncbi:MAG: amidohydrolase family protein, partial [Cyclobacteriaceae bacterium]